MNRDEAMANLATGLTTVTAALCFLLVAAVMDRVKRRAAAPPRQHQPGYSVVR